jgi:hypothetical protein
VTGRVEQGIVRTGDEVEIVGIRPTNTKSIVTGEAAGLGPRDHGFAHKHCVHPSPLPPPPPPLPPNL